MPRYRANRRRRSPLHPHRSVDLGVVGQKTLCNLDAGMRIALSATSHRLAPMLAIAGAIALMIYAFERRPLVVAVTLPPGAHYAAQTIVQREWMDVMNGMTTHDPLWLAIKLPAWGALLALIAMAAMRLDFEPLGHRRIDFTPHL